MKGSVHESSSGTRLIVELRRISPPGTSPGQPLQAVLWHFRLGVVVVPNHHESMKGKDHTMLSNHKLVPRLPPVPPKQGDRSTRIGGARK